MFPPGPVVSGAAPVKGTQFAFTILCKQGNRVAFARSAPQFAAVNCPGTVAREMPISWSESWTC